MSPRHQDAAGGGRPLRLLFWESTAACNLRCAHCRRLEAGASADEELTTDQARRLIDSAAELGRPIFVFSGGEPLLRGDWEALAAHARARGLPAALATNGTLVDDRLAKRIATAGFSRVSVSLDAAEAKAHDAFRGVSGAFDAAVAGIHALRRADVAVQINTTVFAGNADRLDAMYALSEALGAVALHLFVLVPVGCGLELAEGEQITPEQCEETLEWLCLHQAAGGLELRATCAPMYYRVAAQWLERDPAAAGADRLRAGLRSRGCLAGIAVIFVSHAGEVFPCGYLPVRCGSVLDDDLREVWAGSPLLGELRNFGLLAGKCGRCEFKAACGGCRARAFASTDEWLAPDPLCSYEPQSRQ